MTPSSAYNWTTLDEINFISRIINGASYVDKKTRTKDESIRYLRQYIRTLRYRSWTGLGMCVDPHSVILYALECLDDLQGTHWVPPLARSTKYSSRLAYKRSLQEQ